MWFLGAPTDISDVMELQATFTDKNGAPVDPGTVKVTVKRPSGAETTLTYLTDQGLNWRLYLCHQPGSIRDLVLPLAGLGGEHGDGRWGA
jgi:hypothetical protein